MRCLLPFLFAHFFLLHFWPLPYDEIVMKIFLHRLFFFGHSTESLSRKKPLPLIKREETPERESKIETLKISFQRNLPVIVWKPVVGWIGTPP